MSRLTEKLKRLSKGTTTPLGFQPNTTPQETPLLLIPILGPGNAAPDGAGAVLVESTGKPQEQLTPPTGDAPWGVSIDTLGVQKASRLKESGCDFVVLTSLESPAEALDSGMGKLLKVNADLADSHIRALGSLVDAAALDLQSGALSIRCLMDCHRLSGLLGRPLLAWVSPKLSGEEVGRLAEAGVRGIISRASEARLQQWHKALLSRPVSRISSPLELPTPSLPPSPPQGG
ncbi:MAG: hypothetical protein QGH66_05455 [Dehalococcoidia bacterium]|jgi:hypothetical protein|nr:hypothetical protein [Dehalococcoidia bacterium]